MKKNKKIKETDRLRVSNDAMKNALVLILTTLGGYSEQEVKSICAEALEDAYSPEMFDSNGAPSNELMIRVIRERDYWRESPAPGHSNAGAADTYYQLIDELNVPNGGSLVETIDNLLSSHNKLEKKFARALRQRSMYKKRYLELAGTSQLEIDSKALFDQDSKDEIIALKGDLHNLQINSGDTTIMPKYLALLSSMQDALFAIKTDICDLDGNAPNGFNGVVESIDKMIESIDVATK